MLRIKSFRGLRPPPELVAKVACVPYDVVDRDEAAALAAGNPRSLLHVDRAEIDLPPTVDPYSGEVYKTARKNFHRLQTDGSLQREDAPCIYLYEQQMNSHRQTGIAALCHIDDYENDVIKRHERTRKDKEDDRTRLIDTISADTGPVFLTYRDSTEIGKLVGAAKKADSLFDFTAPDGVRHRVWRIDQPEKYVDAFAEFPVAYVADGHHRTASAVRVGAERRARNPNHTGQENYNWFLAVLFPASELQILPYNRCVADLNGRSAGEFLDALKTNFTVRENVDPVPTRPRNISVYLDSRWFGLEWKAGNQSAIAELDVSVLQDRVLAPLLGIDDPRTSKRIEFIGGIRGTRELIDRVDSGRAAVAFSMYPTTVEQLMQIADAGEIMPPKSTWFEPKLRSGLFIHTLD
jgi:uncharacterized protein (DUF1015 family)